MQVRQPPRHLPVVAVPDATHLGHAGDDQDVGVRVFLHPDRVFSIVVVVAHRRHWDAGKVVANELPEPFDKKAPKGEYLQKSHY